MKTIEQLTTAMLAPTDSRAARGKVFKPDANWRAKWLRLDETVHAEVAELARIAENFAKRAASNDPTGPRLLVLGGGCGTGNTHVARAIVRYFNAVAVTVWERGRWPSHVVPSAAFVEWPEIAEAEPGGNSNLWASAVATDLLVLDDVGAESDRFKSGLPVANLARILNSRERRWTCITTNFPPDFWAERYDKRVADRLHRRATLHEIKEAPSYWQSLARAA